MNNDIVSHIQSFCGEEYMYIATVSKMWLGLWCNSRTSRTTSVDEAVNSLSRVRDLLEFNSDKLNNSAYFHACKKGDLDVLEYLYANIRPTEQFVCAGGTVAGGKVYVLEWVVDHGFPVDRFVCHRAAEAGNVEMLKWALLRGFPHDATLLANFN